MALCQCGCGKEAGVYIFTRRRDNQIEGAPKRFLHGHYKRPPVEQRFWNKVDKNGPVPSFRPDLGPCWIWLGGKIEGYGSFWKPSVHILAHRFSYELAKGPIPKGLEPDHLCRVPACVNPDHLEAVTRRVNILRGANQVAIQIRKTHCKNGHPLQGENLAKSYLRRGHRVCRICVRKWEREKYAEKKT